jgi:hypothetical protein
VKVRSQAYACMRAGVASVWLGGSWLSAWRGESLDRQRTGGVALRVLRRPLHLARLGAPPARGRSLRLARAAAAGALAESCQAVLCCGADASLCAACPGVPLVLGYLAPPRT